jgi:hypothetical protein
MLLKNKITATHNLLKEYFYFPACILFFINFIILLYFKIELHFINTTLSFYLLLLFGFLSFFIWLNQTKKALLRKNILNILRSIFLSSIILQIFINFISMSDLVFYYKMHRPLFFITILCGVIIFYFNNKSDEKKIDSQSSPRGWTYRVIIITLLMFFLGLHFFDLGKNNFTNDEFQTIGSAWNFKEVGNFYKWDWLENNSSQYTLLGIQDEWSNYTRAELHTIILAGAYTVFGISEFTSRTVSVLFGAILITLVFLTTLYFTKSKKIAVFSMFLTAFHPSIIELDRYTRMYALLMPISLMLLVTSYLCINQFFKEIYTKKTFILLFISIVLLIAAYNLHNLSLIFIPPILLFIIYLSYFKNKRLFIILAILSLSFLTITILIWDRLINIDQALIFLNLTNIRTYDFNYIYFEFLFKYPIYFISYSLILINCANEVFFKKEKDFFFLYLSLIIGFGLITYIFMIDRFAHPSYISPFLSISIILFSISLFNIIHLFPKKIDGAILVSLISFFCIINFSNNIEYIYGNKNIYFVNYSKGYDELRKIDNNEYINLFYQYERFYYLQDGKFNTFTFGKKDYTPENEQRFFENILKTKNGWVTWEKSTAGDIKNSTREFIQKHFKDLSQPNTNVYLYHYQTEDIRKLIEKYETN